MSGNPTGSTLRQATDHFLKFVDAYSAVLEADDSRRHGGLNSEEFVEHLREFSPIFISAVSRFVHAQGLQYHKLFLLRRLAGQYSDLVLAGRDIGYSDMLKSDNRSEPPQVSAENCYRAATLLDPDWPPPKFNLASLLVERGELEAAARLLTVVAEQSPVLGPDSHWRLAQLLEKLNRDEDAEVHFRAALAGKPHFGVEHRRVADFFRRRGNISESVEQYRVASTFHYYAEPELMIDELRGHSPAPPQETTDDLLMALLKNKGLT